MNHQKKRGSRSVPAVIVSPFDSGLGNTEALSLQLISFGGNPAFTDGQRENTVFFSLRIKGHKDVDVCTFEV